ncbi:TonB-dependent siderophore receptor [Corticimicrobacter populi]|nr:TonB-dependent receptor [Corticimicrobacter populi]
MKPICLQSMAASSSQATARAHCKSSPIVLLSLAVALTSLAPHTAEAQPATASTHRQTTYPFNIAAGPLDDALAAFARQAGISLIYSAQQLRGLRSTGLDGRYDVTQGLGILLSGTGYRAARVEGGIRIEANPSPSTSLLAPVLITGTHNATTEDSQSYAARAATIGKTEQALIDIPQSVTVITRQRLTDQNLTTLSDVLENTTGVTISEVADGGRKFYSRGFTISNIQYDGVPLSRSFYAVGNSFTASTAYLDRVEVFRGAQGLFEGAGQPGGSVNLVRKRPTADTQIRVETRAGSWDHLGGMLDAGGALNQDGSLRARAVLDYDDKGSFIDKVKERNTNLYLALDYDLTPDTTLGAGVLVSRLRSTPFFGGLPRFSDGSDLGLKRSTFLGADWNQWDRNETQVFADLTHQFNSDWRLKIAASHARETSITSALDATGAVDPATLTGPKRNAWNYDKSSEHFGFDANINGRFSVWGMPQDLLVGASMSRLTSSDRIEYNSNYAPLDVFNPDSGIAKPDVFPDSQRLSRYDPHVQKGIYAQLRSSLTEDLTLITGGRMSWFESRYTTQAATWSDVSKSKASAEFTPFLGAVYALSPQWALYASYADIFEPQTATTQDGSILEPIVGANYEAGIKGDLMEGQLTASLAVYRIDQTHRAVQDYAAGPICNGGYCSRAAGKVRSQGFEAELNGELLPGLQVAAGYTYNRNKYLRDPDREGQTFSEETPRHLLRLWSEYRLPGEWNQLSMGLGVNWQSALTNGISNLRRPSYSVWNTRVAYDLTSNWTAALNVNNLFDKVYYEYPGYIENRNNYGTPRSFMLTLRGKF